MRRACVREFVANFRIFVITCPRKIISSSVLLELWPELVGLRPRLWSDLLGIPSMNKMKIGKLENFEMRIISQRTSMQTQSAILTGMLTVGDFVLLARKSEHGQSTVAGRLTWDFTSLVRRSKFRSLYARFRENKPFH